MLALQSLYMRLEDEGEAVDRAVFNELRDSGVVSAVAQLVQHPLPAIHQSALLLLATLTTDEVDPSAAETRRRLRDLPIVAHVAAHVFSDVAITVAFACGAIQNLISDRKLATALLREKGALERLKELRACDQPQVVQAATACLHNVKAVVRNQMRPAPILNPASQPIQPALRRSHSCAPLSSSSRTQAIYGASSRIQTGMGIDARPRGTHCRPGMSSPTKQVAAGSVPLGHQTRSRIGGECDISASACERSQRGLPISTSTGALSKGPLPALRPQTRRKKAHAGPVALPRVVLPPLVNSPKAPKRRPVSLANSPYSPSY